MALKDEKEREREGEGRRERERGETAMTEACQPCEPREMKRARARGERDCLSRFAFHSLKGIELNLYTTKIRLNERPMFTESCVD